MMLVPLLFGCPRSLHWSALPPRLLRPRRHSVRRFATAPPTVAVIGGGIAGLSCAQHLAPHYQVTVFDTGRLRPGGRCSSRSAGDASEQKRQGLLSKYTYDHAAQIVPCPTHPRYRPFYQQLRKWEDQGIVRAFPSYSLFDIFSFDKIEANNEPNFYLGTAEGGGIGGIASHMVRSSGGSYRMKQDVWVSPRDGVEHLAHRNQWKVQGHSGTPRVYEHELYDAIVIAHNGKCADQLMSLMPCTQISKLLKVRFDDKLRNNGVDCMTLSSIYSLTFAIPAKDSLLSKALPRTFWSGFVRSHPSLRFLTCQTRKYPNRSDQSIEVWTVLSSGTFGKHYKAPQEKLPDEMVTRVTRLLLLAVEEALTGKTFTDPDGANAKLPRRSLLESVVLDQHLQLWGAGVPMNVWHSEGGRTPAGFLYDGDYRVGVCGDWLMEASIPGAWYSGRLLAEHMIKQSSKSHGFEGSFRRSLATARDGIGMFQT
jgi:predicted NAD/FAD-dependent oxidoreductase